MTLYGQKEKCPKNTLQPAVLFKNIVIRNENGQNYTHQAFVSKFSSISLNKAVS